MNKDLMNLYKIEKNGVMSIDKKACLCGEEMDNSISVCPRCGINVTKSKMLNINKNNALKKRTIIKDENEIISFTIYGLFSKGFELYEQILLEVVFNRNTENVTISDTKFFKSNADKPEFEAFLNNAFPGFLEFVKRSLRQQEFEYAVTNFGSLRSDQIENFFHIYNSYRALIPYLMGYKILNYGKNVDLKSIYPNVDFNSEDDINKLSLYLPVLMTYDLKNVKYIETITDIYSTRTADELITFNNCIDKMLGLLDKRGINGDDLFDTFSILYNKDISFEDFTRIFLASREDYFTKMMDVKKMKKKLQGKFSWEDIEKIDRKVYGTLCTKFEMVTKGVPKNKLDEIFDLVEKNPMDALDLMANMPIPKEKD